jgi:transposase
MLTELQHKPGEFDPGHCRDCARETDLLDHYHVQHQGQAFKQAHRWARQARRDDATWALWSAGVGVLLATIALRTGRDRLGR